MDITTREAGRRGAAATNAKLTPEERKAKAKKASLARWRKTGGER